MRLLKKIKIIVVITTLIGLTTPAAAQTAAKASETSVQATGQLIDDGVAAVIAKDHKRALEIFGHLAQQGLPFDVYKFGLMYANGSGVRALLRQILNFGVVEDKLIANPVDKVKALAPERVRDRVLSDAEIKSIWEVLEDPTGLLVPDLNPKKPYQSLQVSEQVRLILKLLLLTLARRSEVAGMRIDELNLEQNAWTIPGNRTKNGKANFIPLSPQAKTVIERALELRQQLGLKDSPHVFASPRGTQTAITSNPVSHGMRDICRAVGIEGATTHDLRRTAATNMASERLKIPPFLIGRILNHSGETGGAAAVTMKVYALYDYAAEKREALAKWGELVAKIIMPERYKRSVKS